MVSKIHKLWSLGCNSKWASCAYQDENEVAIPKPNQEQNELDKK